MPASLRAAEELGLSLGRVAGGTGPCRQSGQALLRHGGLKSHGVCVRARVQLHRGQGRGGMKFKSGRGGRQCWRGGWGLRHWKSGGSSPSSVQALGFMTTEYLTQAGTVTSLSSQSK